MKLILHYEPCSTPNRYFVGSQKVSTESYKSKQVLIIFLIYVVYTSAIHEYSKKKPRRKKSFCLILNARLECRNQFNFDN